MGQFLFSAGKNKEQKKLREAILNPDKKIIIVEGLAGTGKTQFALDTMFGMVTSGERHREDCYETVIYTREMVEVGSSMGYLPGTEEEKYAPYLKPYFEYLDLYPKEDKEKLKRSSKAIISQFVRGSNIKNSLVLCDESQNFHPHVLNSIMTRLHDTSKIVIVGSLNQIDDKKLNKNNCGLAYAIEMFGDEKICEVIHLKQNYRGKIAQLSDEKYMEWKDRKTK